MSKQKSFTYKFNDNLSDLNFFVNETNLYAFNGLINNNIQFLFLYGPENSGKSFLSHIWLKKNNAIELKKNFEKILNNTNNVLIDDFLSFDEEKIFYIVNNCILNKVKL